MPGTGRLARDQSFLASGEMCCVLVGPSDKPYSLAPRRLMALYGNLPNSEHHYAFRCGQLLQIFD
jgi:hypothetical protein